MSGFSSMRLLRHHRCQKLPAPVFRTRPSGSHKYPSNSVSLATPTDSRSPGDCVRLVSVRSVFVECEEQTLGIASGMVLECLGPVLHMDTDISRPAYCHFLVLGMWAGRIPEVVDWRASAIVRSYANYDYNLRLL